MINISEADGKQISEILERRANDIASFKSQLETRTSTKFDELPGSVEMALSREIVRLRALANKVKPSQPEED